MLWKRVIAIVSLCVALAFAVAANVSTYWVDANITADGVNHFTYEIGLRDWRLKTNTVGNSEVYSLDNSGSYPFFFYDSYLGSESDWREAGKAAFALGWIGVGLTVVSLALAIASIFIKSIHKAASSIPAWVAGFSFLLGAIIYEGMRPTFHGDMGYQWPMGLYLTAGILADIAAFCMWWADKK